MPKGKPKVQKVVRRNSVLAMCTEAEYEAMTQAAREKGISRSSLVYLLLLEATVGFTQFDVMGAEDPKLGIRHRRELVPN